MAPRIIRDNRTLFASYEELQAGDIVVERVRLRPSEEHILLDLITRGIILIPPALSQLCSRSKILQARLLGEFMIPGTKDVHDLHDLMELVGRYGEMKTGAVICKLDRANGGRGILKFSSVEDVYSQAALGNLTFPFVLQPYLADCSDYRVVMLGDTIEAYRRNNPYNFRHNLHCGGESLPVKLTEEQLSLCQRVMQRGRFPYAHIDLMVTPGGETWLTEINLRGGLRGSTSLSQRDYLRKIEQIHDELLNANLQYQSTNTAQLNRGEDPPSGALPSG